MNLETNRLYIRPSTVDDVDAITTILQDEKTMTYFVEGTYTKKQVQEILKNNETALKHYSVILKDTNQVIGKLSFHSWFMKDTYEIGWIMNKDFTANGYMTEAANRMVKYGFDVLNLHRIIATCQPENIPSKRICEKLGMRLEGTFKKCIHVQDDIWWDELFYALLDEDYQNKQT